MSAALVVGFDHLQHDHIAADARRAPAGKIDGAIAFLGVIDDDKQLRPVTGFIAAAPARHAISPARSYATRKSCCHEAPPSDKRVYFPQHNAKRRAR
jgi:hypothetical protein